jgi:YidC/Oxa1 family membrane protein insertase
MPLNCHLPCQYQKRTMVSWLPEAMQSISIWGGSGYMLKLLHGNDVVPYWACFSLISILVRTALFPVYLHGAHTATKMAKVVPEIQFLVSLFNNDMRAIRARNGTAAEKVRLMKSALRTLRSLYRVHKVNPFRIFLSPVLQFPIFLYISTDLRKITHGLDPILAQELVESPFAWIPDLTIPDPWVGLPIMAGLIMYGNMEVAIGRHSLSGPASSKAHITILLKDIFQSGAIFMPCFTCHLPAGIQIYLMTSFVFTTIQSAAMRTDRIRFLVGLPSMSAPPAEAVIANRFIRIKQLEQKAREMRGDGPILGFHGVLHMGYELSFAGTNRPSTIQGSGISPIHMERPSMKVVEKKPMDLSWVPQAYEDLPYIEGVTAPPWQVREQLHLWQPPAPETEASNIPGQDAMSDITDEMIEKANRGENPMPMRMKFMDASEPGSKSVKKSLSTKRFQKSGKRQKRK